MEDKILGRETLKVLRGQVIRSIICGCVKILEELEILERRLVNQNYLAVRCDALG